MKILLTTFGSLGDLHPYMALGLALKQRGHTVGIATSPNYRVKIEAEGLGFYPVRPDFSEFGETSEWMPKAMDRRRGTDFVLKGMVLPYLADAYADLKQVAMGQDLIVSHPLIYSVPILSEQFGIPWVSVMLQPLTFFSSFDPPILPTPKLLALFRNRGPKFHRWFFDLARKRTLPWMEPVQKLRTDVGLSRTPLHPLFDGLYSPLLNLAIFSRLIGQEQPDWPKNSKITGFLYYDKHDANRELDRQLSTFLADGPPPVVFTLGSSAVNSPGQFYTESAGASKKIGRRAVFLTGRDTSARINEMLPDDLKATVRAFDYAPYSLLFPQACAIVHQGGIGTTAQALRSGKPQLIIPYAHDQPDNAFRIAKLGVGRTMARQAYNANRGADQLKDLIQSGSIAQKAAQVGVLIRAENGEQQACDAIEAVLVAK